MVAFALVRLRFTPLIDFEMYGPWRYWADGLEIARTGHVPASSSQWGVAYTPTSSKIIVNSYHAGASYLLGSAPLPAMGALLWVASLGVWRRRCGRSPGSSAFASAARCWPRWPWC